MIFDGPQSQNFKFRFHLESYVKVSFLYILTYDKKISSQENGNNQWGIPTVNFLISGDINDLMRVRLGLSERQPLVVMKGSGGAAEVVSESLNYFRKKAGFNHFYLHNFPYVF